MDVGKSLRDNLQQTTLLEFPVLHVVLPGSGDWPDRSSNALQLTATAEEEEGEEGVASGGGHGTAPASSLEEGEIDSDSEPATGCSSLELIAQMYS